MHKIAVDMDSGLKNERHHDIVSKPFISTSVGAVGERVMVV